VAVGLVLVVWFLTKSYCSRITLVPFVIKLHAILSAYMRMFSSLPPGAGERGGVNTFSLV
jgi:hypothetical protein